MSDDRRQCHAYVLAALREHMQHRAQDDNWVDSERLAELEAP